jgi:outer membrane protein assembly factor BamA
LKYLILFLALLFAVINGFSQEDSSSSKSSENPAFQLIRTSKHKPDSVNISAVTDSLLKKTEMQDSLVRLIRKNPYLIDSLKLIVQEVVISGTKVTKDIVILREMSLKKNELFTLSKYEDDVQRIYNLGLFTKVEILPIPTFQKHIILNVDVQERWYIFPFPEWGLDEGEWSKLWIGARLRWDNFRGMNENISLFFRVLYNPAVSISYNIPWIGKDIHLFASIRGGYSETQNQSLLAIGRPNGSSTWSRTDTGNFAYYNSAASFTVGKYFSRNFAVFVDIGYTHSRVSEYAPNRTVSPTGVDKYLTFGPGIQFDSRDIREYATKGFYLKANALRYGYPDNVINFGRYALETKSFIPVNITKEYYVTVASRIFTSIAAGAVIPIYQHEYLGYGDNYVRGWNGYGFEGDNVFSFYNELRIPILQPRYISASELPLIGKIPMINKFQLKHGLYFTILYDLGAVWNKYDRIYDIKFMRGAGIGLNFVLPFGFIFRMDWAFRINRPSVGTFIIGTSAKF